MNSIFMGNMRGFQISWRLTPSGFCFDQTLITELLQHYQQALPNAARAITSSLSSPSTTTAPLKFHSDVATKTTTVRLTVTTLQTDVNNIHTDVSTIYTDINDIRTDMGTLHSDSGALSLGQTTLNATVEAITLTKRRCMQTCSISLPMSHQ